MASSASPHRPPPPAPRPGRLVARIARLLRHRWAEGRLHRALPPDLLERLARRVAASEARHTGQIRICAEGGLPASYLWRGASARERAVTLFGKLRVWDTEHNNGVLIYLLLAEQAIEIVADRALARTVPPETWRAMVARMGGAFRAGHYEDGLTQALEEVSALLVAHFPAGGGAGPHGGNELPDAPVLAGSALREA
ncbi:TPM domain-containing protein [Paracidovorax anthurii]|uniref:TLP18.3/Psb32/MOLO-1 phosphatase superfamily protein n=1 Tax=Paracidovorax anthurii TaxID=78229 RepID=A0A328YS83_9BURK|nr:TPM domain-containing protein [Paracidovorax anthurii]RAR76699.1 TLP18.3/Psb32/MOLO-1 phosphatase superfamily protein [Paracidovorax anthurii]